MRPPLTSSRKLWRGALAVGAVCVAIMIPIYLAFPDQQTGLSRREARHQLCAQAAEWILESESLVSLERGKFVSKELRCDFRRHVLGSALNSTSRAQERPT